MTVEFEHVTIIDAPTEVVFDLSLDIDAHLASMADSGERAIAGVTGGQIGLGETVTWRARHFGRVFEHTSEITAFERPRYFRDEMVRGQFRVFRHDHHFEAVADGTRMTDVLDYAAPFGILGRFAERTFLTAYLRRLLRERNEAIRRAAEE